MFDRGIRLQLQIGRETPAQAPFELVDALIDAEITISDSGNDAFRLSFALARNPMREHDLLADGLLNPLNRVIILALGRSRPEVIIDGVITQHHVTPSNRPGESTLQVYGGDLSVKLDLEEKKQSHPNQSDSGIVTSILQSYATLGLMPQVTETTERPTESERTPQQHSTDLNFIRELAKRNPGFVFYLEPTEIPAQVEAYWGPKQRSRNPQPPLSMNMGAYTNVDSPIRFNFDGLGPVEQKTSVNDPDTGERIEISSSGSSVESLSRDIARVFRQTVSRDAARLSTGQAQSSAAAASTSAADAVTATGEIDVVRYGHILRARRPVEVRGVGQSYNGKYYVQQVTHHIKRGEYKQSFTLLRDGLGSRSQTVRTEESLN